MRERRELENGKSPCITISIVSHGHGELVFQLLNDIKSHCCNVWVVLTINTPEILPFSKNQFPFVSEIIRNTSPQGFAANHNAAFSKNHSEYFCVLNPDVRIHTNPFPELLKTIEEMHEIGVIAPLVKNDDGKVEVTARRFPSPFSLLKKVFLKKNRHDYEYNTSLVRPDWVGGMFMLFSAVTLSQIKGFDERFFLYYEDVDICTRLANEGKLIILVSNVSVVHNAQRDSHRKLKYFLWHVSSICRYFISKAYLKRVLNRRFGGSRASGYNP